MSLQSGMSSVISSAFFPLVESGIDVFCGQRRCFAIPLVLRSIPDKAVPSQKPLLRKLLSFFNLRELYLFIICSRAMLLWQGIVSRGNLSLLSPQPLLQGGRVFALLFLHCSSSEQGGGGRRGGL